jgi:hypothetical protein
MDNDYYDEISGTWMTANSFFGFSAPVFKPSKDDLKAILKEIDEELVRLKGAFETRINYTPPYNHLTLSNSKSKCTGGIMTDRYFKDRCHKCRVHYIERKLLPYYKLGEEKLGKKYWKRLNKAWEKVQNTTLGFVYKIDYSPEVGTTDRFLDRCAPDKTDRIRTTKLYEMYVAFMEGGDALTKQQLHQRLKDMGIKKVKSNGYESFKMRYKKE